VFSLIEESRLCFPLIFERAERTCAIVAHIMEWKGFGFVVTTRNTFPERFKTAKHGQTMSTTTLPPSLFRTWATSLLRDYAELTKLRVTSLIVMPAEA
jgi:hypothetical protein